MAYKFPDWGWTIVYKQSELFKKMLQEQRNKNNKKEPTFV